MEKEKLDFSLTKDFCEEHLEKAKSLFLNLEKSYYKLLQNYEHIDKELSYIENTGDKQDLLLVKNRAVQLKRLLTKIRKKRGYEFYDFHRIFEAFDRFEKKLPEEMAGAGNLESIKIIWENEIKKHFPHSGGKHSAEENVFCIVKSCELGFLLSTDSVLWTKKIETAKSRVSVRMQNSGGPQTYTFYNLPKSNPPQSPHKIALLIKNPKGEIGGFLVDEYLGKIAVSKKALKKKTEYFHIGNNTYEPYLTLKGERFYIKNDYTNYM